jgi:uncharacterized phage-associated protein
MSKAKQRAADVARYIVRQHGAMPQMKLQKLLYYCEAASQAWYEEPLFDDIIEAWAGGPVVASFWNNHRYESPISSVPEGAPLNSERARNIADRIWNAYGTYNSGQLSSMTHVEEPWLEARQKGRARDGESARTPIDRMTMRRFYKRAWG